LRLASFFTIKEKQENTNPDGVAQVRHWDCIPMVTIWTSQQNHGRFSWSLTSRDLVKVRVS